MRVSLETLMQMSSFTPLSNHSGSTTRILAISKSKLWSSYVDGAETPQMPLSLQYTLRINIHQPDCSIHLYLEKATSLAAEPNWYKTGVKEAPSIFESPNPLSPRVILDLNSGTTCRSLELGGGGGEISKAVF